jgi:hypothetical protein
MWEVIEMKKYLITTTICLVLMASVAYGAIIHVPGDKPTIQAGIDAASNGDTVLVAGIIPYTISGKFFFNTPIGKIPIPFSKSGELPDIRLTCLI